MVINPLHDDYFGSPLALKEAILNLAAFIPFGVLYYRTTQLQMAILTLLTITGIETIQYVFNVGVFSTGDIILNFIGCLIGYRIARILQKRLLKNQSSFH
jgi:glycopeptide antibiotics resistance protein